LSQEIGGLSQEIAGLSQEAGGSPQEIGLRLELTATAAAALVASGLLAGDPAALQSHSVYFDTPGQDLSAAGFSLRIREAEGERVQIVKATGSAAGLFVRPEWNLPVQADVPILDDTSPVAALLGTRLHEIGPAFTVDMQRRVWNVLSDEAEIELALDEGEIVAGERRTPICELKLELKRGTPAALFALARRLDAVAPLRLRVLGKAERGYRLLGPAAGAVKAEPVTMTSDMDAAAAFRHIAGACLRQYRLNEGLLGGRDAEAVHQARVALRRLRSAFSIYKPMLEDGRFQHLRDETRWLAVSLGAMRDVDVLIERCEVETVRARLVQARAEAANLALAELASRRARVLMLDLSEWLAAGDWRSQPSGEEIRGQPARDFAAAALDRFRRKVRKGGRDLAELDDAARHEVRKDAKKLRYAAEFFSSFFQGKRQKRRLKRFVEALAALQDRLGALNDHAVTEHVLSRLGLDRDPDAAHLAAAEDKQVLIEAAAEAHDAFSDAKRFWR